ncbi:unnamed protein product [Rotaria sordida]|uniref:B box-type domain-containing protein n=1 Tax=Rotaria sordida TaxID=392033 RepID=A0A819UDA0_9BILA|nr:unnamed protein product [Rotaria sordida]
MNSDQHQTVFPCTISKCNNKSCVLCYCCQKNYCIHHLIEHNDSNNNKLNLLNDEINKLDHEIKTLNIQPLVENCRQKLEQWRMESYHKIDQFFERKFHEFHRFIDEKFDHQRMEIRRLQSKMTEYSHKQEIYDEELYSLIPIIDNLRTEINNFKQINNQMNIHPLPIDDNVINIDNINVHKFNLSTLSTIYKTINHPHGSYGTLACNDKFMLIYLVPNLILIDKQLNIINQVLWPYQSISNICWSSTLDRFLIIEKSKIYLVNDQTMSIENLQMIEKQIWFSCTCSDTSLFLSLDEISSSIMEFNLLPSIKLVNKWKSPYTCNKNEYIDNIVYDNFKLALMITNKLQKSVRMELRSSKTLQRIWSLQLDIVCCQNKPFRCCSINSNEWLVADYQNRRLLHITEDGNLKTMITYDSIPCHVVLFGLDTLVISRNSGINFHRLEVLI